MPENVMESFLKALFQVLCQCREHIALTPGSAAGVRTLRGASSADTGQGRGVRVKNHFSPRNPGGNGHRQNPVKAGDWPEHRVITFRMQAQLMKMAWLTVEIELHSS